MDFYVLGLQCPCSGWSPLYSFTHVTHCFGLNYLYWSKIYSAYPDMLAKFYCFWRETSKSPVNWPTTNQRLTNRLQRKQNKAAIGHSGVDAPLTMCLMCGKTWPLWRQNNQWHRWGAVDQSCQLAILRIADCYFFAAAAVSNWENDTLSLRGSYSQQEYYFLSE